MQQLCVTMHPDRNGNHLVHREKCSAWPAPSNTRLLGLFDYCDDGLRAARMFFAQVDGCAQCLPQCNAAFQIHELCGENS